MRRTRSAMRRKEGPCKGRLFGACFTWIVRGAANEPETLCPVPAKAPEGAWMRCQKESRSPPTNCHHHLALARANVALEVNDLLPGAAHELPVPYGHREFRPEHRGLQV